MSEPNAGSGKDSRYTDFPGHSRVGQSWVAPSHLAYGIIKTSLFRDLPAQHYSRGIFLPVYRSERVFLEGVSYLFVLQSGLRGVGSLVNRLSLTEVGNMCHVAPYKRIRVASAL